MDAEFHYDNPDQGALLGGPSTPPLGPRQVPTFREGTVKEAIGCCRELCPLLCRFAHFVT